MIANFYTLPNMGKKHIIQHSHHTACVFTDKSRKFSVLNITACYSFLQYNVFLMDFHHPLLAQCVVVQLICRVLDRERVCLILLSYQNAILSMHTRSWSVELGLFLFLFSFLIKEIKEKYIWDIHEIFIFLALLM